MCEVLLLKVEEAARRLGLGRSLTYTFIQSGALPSIRIGGARRVLASDLDIFIESLRAAQLEDGHE